MTPFGVMFHHFHGGGHPKGQGAISAEELELLLLGLGPERILPAKEWMRRALTGGLGQGDICLTFDDNLLCQYDIALPVLEKMGLSAFWFVYTSPNQGIPDHLEIYRYYRTTKFANVDQFYESFFSRLMSGPWAREAEAALKGFDPASHLRDFPFYSDQDRKFRYVRDLVLGPERYTAAMEDMLMHDGVDKRSLAGKLWMTDEQLKGLHDKGHVIGLHSHNHPTRMDLLDKAAQAAEYRANFDHLARLLDQAPRSMSHPCNAYNRDTLDILREMGIELGFRANMAQPQKRGLEYPREDHANLVRGMQGGSACA